MIFLFQELLSETDTTPHWKYFEIIFKISRCFYLMITLRLQKCFKTSRIDRTRKRLKRLKRNHEINVCNEIGHRLKWVESDLFSCSYAVSAKKISTVRLNKRFSLKAYFPRPWSASKIDNIGLNLVPCNASTLKIFNVESSSCQTNKNTGLEWLYIVIIRFIVYFTNCNWSDDQLHKYVHVTLHWRRLQSSCIVNGCSIWIFFSFNAFIRVVDQLFLIQTTKFCNL